MTATDQSLLLKECPWSIGDTVVPDSAYGHPGEVTDPDDPAGQGRPEAYPWHLVLEAAGRLVEACH